MTRFKLQQTFYEEMKVNCVDEKGEYDTLYVHWLENKLIFQDITNESMRSAAMEKAKDHWFSGSFWLKKY